MGFSTFTITVQAMPDDRPAETRLRAWLKAGLRLHGLRCTLAKATGCPQTLADETATGRPSTLLNSPQERRQSDLLTCQQVTCQEPDPG